ncbi:MAG: alpha/beta hydrolase [Selenomonadaceae bacterium]|nr:alpha/beta hydrolase [Selenomonadaceae bacterium]
MKEIIYIHGKGGNAAESEHYKKFFPAAEVIGFDYKAENIFDAVTEFQNFFYLREKVTIIANSIGAFYAMHALSEKNIDRAFFISPVVDMEKIILEMMTRANVTEKNLRDAEEIVTDFGEILSWKYLCYVRENPIDWKVPTNILYGSKDFLTSLETMKNFAEKICASLTVMQGGEHWFHTSEQMKFLDNWLEENLK